ncbi:hypothetical protein ACPPVO_34525 [Dactylosporangium sp. McL0621]|uniref:hypothetical protein n=1 Tax=Dactylosporangium sp. McL0621 TaxID=3415678 RepID=UPI003CF6E55D
MEVVIRRPPSFRPFRDHTAEIVETGSQVCLGLVFAGVGLALGLGAGLDGVTGWVWLSVFSGTGLAWAVWSAVRLGRRLIHTRRLRSAVAGTATVTVLRATGFYADEWHRREFVDIALSVTTGDGAPRTMVTREALTGDQRAGLTVGTVVGVHAHPRRPAVRIDWDTSA